MLKLICTILASCAFSNALCSVCDMHNSASQVPRHFWEANWLVGTILLCSINHPRQTDTRRSNTFEKYLSYENWSVVGNRGGRWTLRNRGDIGLSPASLETTKTNEPPKNYNKMGGQNISSFRGEYRFWTFFLLFTFRKLCIEQLLYRIESENVFVPVFFFVRLILIGLT